MGLFFQVFFEWNHTIALIPIHFPHKQETSERPRRIWSVGLFLFFPNPGSSRLLAMFVFFSSFFCRPGITAVIPGRRSLRLVGGRAGGGGELKLAIPKSGRVLPLRCNILLGIFSPFSPRVKKKGGVFFFLFSWQKKTKNNNM